MAETSSMRKLDIGRQFEVLRGTEPPKVDGHPMTIGEAIVRMIPVIASGSDYMRVWNLASDIDRALGADETTFELRADDLRTLKQTCIERNHHELWGQNWVKANLDMAFEEVGKVNPDDDRREGSEE